MGKKKLDSRAHRQPRELDKYRLPRLLPSANKYQVLIRARISTQYLLPRNACNHIGYLCLAVPPRGALRVRRNGTYWYFSGACTCLLPVPHTATPNLPRANPCQLEQRALIFECSKK